MSKRKRIVRVVPIQDDRTIRIKEMRQELGYIATNHWTAIQAQWRSYNNQLTLNS